MKTPPVSNEFVQEGCEQFVEGNRSLIDTMKEALPVIIHYYGATGLFTKKYEAAIAAMGDGTTRKDDADAHNIVCTSPANSSEILDNYELTQRIEESLAYFCDEFPKAYRPEIWAKPISRHCGGITPDDLQTLLSILYAHKPVLSKEEMQQEYNRGVDAGFEAGMKSALAGNHLKGSAIEQPVVNTDKWEDITIRVCKDEESKPGDGKWIEYMGVRYYAEANKREVGCDK